MAFKVDRLLVVDVEATCWESRREQSEKNQEIIEVGVVDLALRDTVEVVGTFGTYVEPTTSEVSEFCTKLTGIGPSMVKGAISFEKLCDLWLREEHKVHRLPWMSWGDFDRLAFERQCAREGVAYPWGRTHFNLKSLFAVAMNLREQVGVRHALSMLGLEFEGSEHRALDDAVNIARIAVEILTKMRIAAREPYE